MDNVRLMNHPRDTPADDGPTPPQHLERTPPQDLDAEQSVLGGMLLSNAVIPDVTTAMQATDHYRPAHETIHATILDLAGRGEPADPITLTAELTRTGQLQRIGGASYLHHLTQVTPSPAHAAYYAEIVHEKALLRRVVEIGTGMAARAYKGDLNPHDILSNARTDLTTISSTSATNSRLVDGATFILNRPDQVPAVWGEGEQVLWAEGEALLIAGPAGVGKTTLAQQVILAAIGIRPHALGLAVRPAKRVLYLASDRPQQAARSFARMVTAEDSPALQQHLVFWPGPPPSDFIKDPSTLVRLCREADADMVCLDSLKDMAGELASEEGGQAINSAIQRTLVENIEVIGLHHHRKQGGGREGGKEPTSLDELYGSTWITAGAGSVLSLWGAAGDPVVAMKHLKQPAAECGPWKLRHDHPRGVTEIWHEVDVLDVLVHARSPLTPTQLAGQVYEISGNSKPSSAQREKARRRLEQLVEKGLAHKVHGGGGRGNETGYVAAFSPSGEER